MAKTPTIISNTTPIAFLEHILNNHSPPSFLIICSTKAAFHASLDPTSSELFQSPPTLRLLATSHTLKLVFCPEIPHLLAYLATYTTSTANEKDIALRMENVEPILAIWGMYEQEEASVQSLMRLMATAVEAAARNGMRLIIGSSGDSLEEEVPMLSSSRKSVVNVGRKVKVKDILGRWM